MTDNRFTAPRKPAPFAREIALYTDEELDQYLVECGRVVNVQDPENIQPEFVQRLRDVIERERRDVHSHAVDLDEVAARLQTVPTETERYNRSPSIGTTEPLPSKEEQDLRDLRAEIESYPALVEAGGRPPYPLHILEDFFWNVHKYVEHDQYRDIVLFYRYYVSDEDEAERTTVCADHLRRWRRFQRSQHVIREQSLNCEGTLMESATFDSWEKFLEHPFCSAEWSGKWDFQEYAENIKARLTKYGFSRPFQLDQNSDRQDKLTTWIEYLGYEYYYYDTAASYVKSNQRLHDRAWQKLANLLGPEDTYDAILHLPNQHKRWDEAKRAEKAVESAAANISSTERAIDKSDACGRVLRTRLLAEKSSLTAAKETLSSIVTRNQAISNFNLSMRYYLSEQRVMNRFGLLLGWILRQIPFIESELNSNRSAETSPNSNNRSTRVKRARHEESKDADYSGTETSKCSRHDSIDSKRPSKRLKSSSQGLASHSVPDASAATTSALMVPTSMTHSMGVRNNSIDDPS